MERVMVPNHSKQAGVAVVSASMLGIMMLLGVELAGEPVVREENLIRRVVTQTTRSGIAIRAVREMRAGTLSGKHTGWMRVETHLTPAGAFTWSVLEEGGSDRTREKVFRAVLETEAESWRDGDGDQAALTPENYVFTLMDSSRPGEVQIKLTPRRKDTRLVDGTLTVSTDGYPIRLEGKLAKSPSFWVKSVHIVKRYSRFAGVALPTVLESTADLRFVGKSVFTMRYSYQEVNGRTFARAAATNDSQQ
jgi:hypothetical protein